MKPSLSHRSGQNSAAVGGSGRYAGELLLVSLGACAGGRVVSYDLRHPRDRLRVEISSERTERIDHYQSIRVLLKVEPEPVTGGEELNRMFLAGRIHATLTKAGDPNLAGHSKRGALTGRMLHARVGAHGKDDGGKR